MKKLFVVPAIAYLLLTTTSLFAQQHTQSLSLSGPGQIPYGPTTFTVSVNLTFGGYSSFGLSYWLEVDNALAPFISLTSVTYFTFPDPNQLNPNPAPFNSTSGSTAGFMLETRDLGATVNDPTMKMIPPGTYHIADLTFSLAPGNPGGFHTLRTTTLSPRVSEVTDTDFNDNNLPSASITFGIVPEPSTFALVSFGIAGASVLVWRRRMKQSGD